MHGQRRHAFQLYIFSVPELDIVIASTGLLDKLNQNRHMRLEAIAAQLKPLPWPFPRTVSRCLCQSWSRTPSCTDPEPRCSTRAMRSISGRQGPSRSLVDRCLFPPKRVCSGPPIQCHGKRKSWCSRRLYIVHP
jgi:hypothetical protein